MEKTGKNQRSIWIGQLPGQPMLGMKLRIKAADDGNIDTGKKYQVRIYNPGRPGAESESTWTGGALDERSIQSFLSREDIRSLRRGPSEYMRFVSFVPNAHAIPDLTRKGTQILGKQGDDSASLSPGVLALLSQPDWEDPQTPLTSHIRQLKDQQLAVHLRAFQNEWCGDMSFVASAALGSAENAAAAGDSFKHLGDRLRAQGDDADRIMSGILSAERPDSPRYVARYGGRNGRDQPTLFARALTYATQAEVDNFFTFLEHAKISPRYRLDFLGKTPSQRSASIMFICEHSAMSGQPARLKTILDKIQALNRRTPGGVAGGASAYASREEAFSSTINAWYAEVESCQRWYPNDKARSPHYQQHHDQIVDFLRFRDRAEV
jgi:hypothetical protein